MVVATVITVEERVVPVLFIAICKTGNVLVIVTSGLSWRTVEVEF